MTRASRAIRVLLLEWPGMVAWIWGVTLLAFGISVGIYAFLSDEARASSQTFGLSALLIVWFVLQTQLVTDRFPFAVGFGLTRHEFFRAVSILIAGQAAVYGVAIAGLARVEDATSGWGVALEFFRPAGLDTGNVAGDAAAWTVVFAGAGALAVVSASIHMRWGVRGLFATGAGVLAVGGLTAIAVTAADQWGEVAGWLGDQSALFLMTMLPAPFVVALAAAGYATMRRMVP